MQRISSTRIRELVSEGEIAEANDLLGHTLSLTGKVKHGDERGRLIGFPTANLESDPHKLLPANGVYAVRATVNDTETAIRDKQELSTVYNAVANIGIRPTFNGKERLVEVHLLDTHLNLYDRYLTVEILARLRSEQRFSGVDALKAQIANDVQQARQLFTS
jgi:riboflavin kinase/FMN adenylyltransferase